MGQQCWGYLLRGATAYPPAGSTAGWGSQPAQPDSQGSQSLWGLTAAFIPSSSAGSWEQPGWAGPDGFLLPVSPCSCLPASLPFFFG